MVLIPPNNAIGEGEFNDLASDDEVQKDADGASIPLIEERLRNKYDFSLDMVRIRILR